MKRRRRLGPYVAVLALLGLALIFSAPAWAWWPDFQEWGMGFHAQRSIDVKGGNLGALGLNLQTSAPLYASGDWRLDLRLEMNVGGFWNYAQGTELAFSGGLRQYFPRFPHHDLAPFLEAGIGPSWEDLHIPEIGCRLNFLSFGGLGARYGLNSRTSLELGYRLRHISNGGLDEQNHGVTSHSFHLDLAWRF